MHGVVRHCGRTRMGGWAVACSPILGTTITLKRLEKRGYQSLLYYYKTATDDQRTAVYEARTHGGVTGLAIQRRTGGHLTVSRLLD